MTIHSSSHIYVREHHIVKSSFNTTLPLHYYPNDVQELNISIGSLVDNDKVKLRSSTSNNSIWYQ
jgi:hypothetical protein